MNLSPNFTLDELTHSDMASRKGWENTPNAAEIDNLKRLAAFLERVREVVGKPITINSGYRAKVLNDALGSKDTSQHRFGCAADIRVAGMTPRTVMEKILAADLDFDQCLLEFATPDGGGWVHVSIPTYVVSGPRKQALIIDRTGVRPFK
jgi:zinc D-Ala-D-Ala carboxypeptidase